MDIKDKELHRIALTAIIYNDEGKYLITQRSLQLSLEKCAKK